MRFVLRGCMGVVFSRFMSPAAMVVKPTRFNQSWR